MTDCLKRVLSQRGTHKMSFYWSRNPENPGRICIFKCFPDSNFFRLGLSPWCKKNSLSHSGANSSPSLTNLLSDTQVFTILQNIAVKFFYRRSKIESEHQKVIYANSVLIRIFWLYVESIGMLDHHLEPNNERLMGYKEPSNASHWEGMSPYLSRPKPWWAILFWLELC